MAGRVIAVRDIAGRIRSRWRVMTLGMHAAWLWIARGILIHVAWLADRRRVARRRAGVEGALILLLMGRIPRRVGRVAWMGRSAMLAVSLGGWRWLVASTGIQGEFLVSMHCLCRAGQGNELIRTGGGCRVRFSPLENVWRALLSGCRRSKQGVRIVFAGFGAEHMLGQGEQPGTALCRFRSAVRSAGPDCRRRRSG